MSEVDKIKVKVFNLLQKTVENGCTESEAMTAMAIAGRLMDTYQLNMSDIQIREEKCVQDRVQSPTRNRDSGVDGCMLALARYCDLKIWFSSGRTESHYGIFGLSQDVELFKYLYDIISNTVDLETKKFKKSDIYIQSTNRRGATTSFRKGFSSGISSKLTQMKNEREQEVREQRRTGTDLVVIKNEIIEEEFANTGITLRKKYSYNRNAGNYGARQQGYKKGLNTNLNRGVKGSGQRQIANG